MDNRMEGNFGLLRVERKNGSEISQEIFNADSPDAFGKTGRAHE